MKIKYLGDDEWFTRGKVYEVQDQLVQSQSMVLTDLISLYKALGGGWEINEPAPAPVASESPPKAI